MLLWSKGVRVCGHPPVWPTAPKDSGRGRTGFPVLGPWRCRAVPCRAAGWRPALGPAQPRRWSGSGCGSGGQSGRAAPGGIAAVALGGAAPSMARGVGGFALCPEVCRGAPKWRMPRFPALRLRARCKPKASGPSRVSRSGVQGALGRFVPGSCASAHLRAPNTSSSICASFPLLGCFIKWMITCICKSNSIYY